MTRYIEYTPYNAAQHINQEVVHRQNHVVLWYTAFDDLSHLNLQTSEIIQAIKDICIRLLNPHLPQNRGGGGYPAVLLHYVHQNQLETSLLYSFFPPEHKKRKRKADEKADEEAFWPCIDADLAAAFKAKNVTFTSETKRLMEEKQIRGLNAFRHILTPRPVGIGQSEISNVTDSDVAELLRNQLTVHEGQIRMEVLMNLFGGEIGVASSMSSTSAVATSAVAAAEILDPFMMADVLVQKGYTNATEMNVMHPDELLELGNLPDAIATALRFFDFSNNVLFVPRLASFWTCIIASLLATRELPSVGEAEASYANPVFDAGGGDASFGGQIVFLSKRGEQIRIACHVSGIASASRESFYNGVVNLKSAIEEVIKMQFNEFSDETEDNLIFQAHMASIRYPPLRSAFPFLVPFASSKLTDGVRRPP